MITTETLLPVRVAAATIGAFLFLLLFVVVGFLGLPIPINFSMVALGFALGWYLPGKAIS